MWRLKGCPKCRGDLCVHRDLDGWCEECLQCGYVGDAWVEQDMRSGARAGRKRAGAKKVPALAGVPVRRK